MDLYMKIEGVIGEVTKKPYGGWIRLSSFSWNDDRSPGGSKSVSVTKLRDRTSPLLWKIVVNGDRRNVSIHFANDDGPPTLIIDMESAVITRFQYSPAASDDMPGTELVSVAAAKVTLSPVGLDPNKAPQSDSQDSSSDP